MVFMTRFLGPDMKARQNESTKSAIINMTHSHSDAPMKSQPIFSATKQFADVFSQNLWFENQEMDILTVKNLPSKCERYPLGVDPKDTVEGVFKDLGNNRVSYGHYTHSLFKFWYYFKMCPTFFNSNSVLGKYYGL